ncbi:respiratory chain complex I subunit 1 family protein [Helicovermis profundi]|uniref:Respiratory chain complex I subunit 1 family protein n=1 Tax=Helicovermis profundi TaxID=3065157 RepID=A0AAU9EES0_9FIRM|nr:respiratory chain complex I subunit 1 family protein [Clostridia bacterium S502]
MVILNILLYAFGSILVGLTFMGIGRKVTARVHLRYGPPFYQSIMDVIKLLSRKSITHNFVMDLGMIMSLAGLIGTMLYVPISGHTAFISNTNIVVIMYLMAIGYLGMAMAVAASGNPNAAIGVSRALTMMLGYEVPFFTVILGLIIFNNSSSVAVIAASQAGSIWNWNIWHMPLGYIAAEITLQAMMGEKPFDAMIAPAEIASGPMVELSGKYLGLGFLTHAVSIFVETGLIVNFFFGGGANPIDFVLKQLGVYLVAVIFDNIFPRYKIEQAVKFLWIFPMGLAVVQLLLLAF